MQRAIHPNFSDGPSARKKYDLQALPSPQDSRNNSTILDFSLHNYVTLTIYFLNEKMIKIWWLSWKIACEINRLIWNFINTDEISDLMPLVTRCNYIIMVKVLPIVWRNKVPKSSTLSIQFISFFIKLINLQKSFITKITLRFRLVAAFSYKISENVQADYSFGHFCLRIYVRNFENIQRPPGSIFMKISSFFCSPNFSEKSKSLAV